MPDTNAQHPTRLAVIVGSTRKDRFGPVVADWFTAHARERADLDVDVIDLAEADLPHVLEGPGEDGTHPSAAVRAFAARIDRADVFAVITPEYNRGYPAALKQAIDSVYTEFHAKPVGFVSYSGGATGGVRAVEQLRSVFAELHTVTLRDGVAIPSAYAAFDDDGQPRDTEGVNGAAKKLLDQLLWWAVALREARARSPYTA
ncbi:NADPH-dependent FMN reductase [Streptomyces telluris]|uniref:NAD(P)H-dependent oxidoreductase n=2 Tax=Streptomyces telluris TaxID=2720021 RepID=A0A9X2LMT8_9ACTN|nr:NAD(P)H-dependent oxidoreductase [Streptomyces telluris]MCQ8774726.1 NAD(P)H-dependent oxidoreductase [Streptomyces telluris]